MTAAHRPPAQPVLTLLTRLSLTVVRSVRRRATAALGGLALAYIAARAARAHAGDPNRTTDDDVVPPLEPATHRRDNRSTQPGRPRLYLVADRGWVRS